MQISVLYLLVGVAWVFFSNRLAASTISSYADFVILDIIKDSLFVVITAFLLCQIIAYHFKRIRIAEGNIIKGEMWLKMALTASQTGVWEWDLVTNKVAWSPECYEIVGMKDFDGMFDSFSRVLHPEDVDHALSAVKKALAEHVEYCDEFRIIRPDNGEVRWLVHHGHGSYDRNGAPLVLMGTVRDITERKQIELQLLESEERYRAVVEDQTEVITRYGPDGTYTFVNDIYCRFFGKSREDLLGKTWMPEAYPADVPLIEAKLRDMNPQNPVVVIENRVYAGSGEVRWMQFVNRGFFDANGVLVETQAVGRDVTERKSAEEAARKYAAVVQDLYDNAPCGYHSLDADGIYVRINDTELQWLGYDRDEIIGKKSFADLITPESMEVFHNNFRIFKEQGHVDGLEYLMLRKDGSSMPVLLSATAIRDKQGKYVMSRGVLLDITDRKQAEETLRGYSMRMIELEEEMRKKLAAELHDDIGRDLSALGLNFAIIKNGLSRESKATLGGRIEDSSMLIEGLSRSIRDIMLNLRPSVLDDYGLASALRGQADLYAKRYGIAVDLQVEDTAHRLSEHVETALFRIAQEALANVAKHAEANNVEINLGGGGAGGKWLLSIADDGRGFDAAADGHSDTGSGWGVTIMRERAKSVGAHFYLDSEPEKGTVVSVELEGGAQ
jgi:PAS domain S-box-containing protein